MQKTVLAKDLRHSDILELAGARVIITDVEIDNAVDGDVRLTGYFINDEECGMITTMNKYMLVTISRSM